jgi:Putative bacterial sensory transduction regulator
MNMARVDILIPYVEKLLRDFSGKKDLGPDKAGRYPLELGSARYFVTVGTTKPGDLPVVQIWSVVLDKVEKSPELFEELNNINGSILFGRVYWAQSKVWAVAEIMASDLDASELTNACMAIGDITDRHDDQLKQKFGGEIKVKNPLT